MRHFLLQAVIFRATNSLDLITLYVNQIFAALSAFVVIGLRRIGRAAVEELGNHFSVFANYRPTMVFPLDHADFRRA